MTSRHGNSIKLNADFIVVVNNLNFFPDSWLNYLINVLSDKYCWSRFGWNKQNILDDFEKVNKKLKEAQDTSDLQTDAENHRSKKRKITPRKVYDSTSDEDEEENERLSRPPRILKGTGTIPMFSLCSPKDNASCSIDHNKSKVCNFEEKPSELPAYLNTTPSRSALSSGGTCDCLILS